MVSNPLWGVQPVEVYAAATSVRAGESLSFHVSVADPAPPAAVHLAVYRCDQFDYGPENPFGRVAGEIYQGDYRGMLSPRDAEAAAYLADLDAASYPVGTDASQSGCGWPSATVWEVPDDVTAGVHIAVATYRGDRAYALFVVRPSRPGVATSILCQLACTTHQAYNP